MTALVVKVVKTVEGLAALPPGTILADNGGWPFWHDRVRGWCAANGIHDVDPATAIRDGGPFTVLFHPEVPRRTEQDVAAEVLRDAAAEIPTVFTRSVGNNASTWLRARADRIEGEARNG